MITEFNKELINENVKDCINGLVEPLALNKDDLQVYINYKEWAAYTKGVAEGKRVQMNETTLTRANNSFNLASKAMNDLKQLMKENGVELDG